MMATSADLDKNNTSRKINNNKEHQQQQHQRRENRQEKQQARSKRGENLSSSLIDARSSTLLRNNMDYNDANRHNNNNNNGNKTEELQNRISPAGQFATRLASLTSQRHQQQQQPFQLTSGLIRAPQREAISKHLVAKGTNENANEQLLQKTSHQHPVLKQANQRHATSATNLSSSSGVDQARERFALGANKPSVIQQEVHLLRRTQDKVINADMLQHARSYNATMAIKINNNNNDNNEINNPRIDCLEGTRTKPMLATTTTKTATTSHDKDTPMNNNIIFPLTNNNANLIPTSPPAQFTPLQNNSNFSHQQATTSNNHSHQYNSNNNNNINGANSYPNAIGFRAATPSANAVANPNPPPYLASATGLAMNCGNSASPAHNSVANNATRSLQRTRQNTNATSDAASNLQQQQHRISLAQHGIFRSHQMSIGAQFSPNTMLLNAPNSNAAPTIHHQARQQHQQVPNARTNNSLQQQQQQLQNHQSNINNNNHSNNNNNINPQQQQEQQQQRLQNVITSSPMAEFSRNLQQVRSNIVSISNNNNNIFLSDQQSKQVNNCADISIKWYIVVIALLGLICALVGTILGAVHSTAGRDYISLSLLLIGVGLVLIAITWIALRVCISTYRKSRSSSNLQTNSSLATHRLSLGLQSFMGNSTNQLQLDHRLASLVHPPPHQLSSVAASAAANSSAAAPIAGNPNRPLLLNERLYLMAVASAAVAAAASQQQQQQAARLQQSQQQADCESNTNNHNNTNWPNWTPGSNSDNLDRHRWASGASNRRVELQNRFTQFCRNIWSRLSARRNSNGVANLEPASAFCDPIQVARHSQLTDQPAPIPANPAALAAFLSHYQAALFHHQQLASGPRALFGPDSRPPPPSYNASIIHDRWRTFQQQQHHMVTLRMQSPRGHAPAPPELPSQAQQPAPMVQQQTLNITQQNQQQHQQNQNQQTFLDNPHNSEMMENSNSLRRDSARTGGLNCETANRLNGKHTI